jgi:flagellar biosynthesis protein FlhB
VSLVFLPIVFVCVLRSVIIPWKIGLYLFGVCILRSALLRSTTLNPVDQLEHLISKVNWVNFVINSVYISFFS